MNRSIDERYDPQAIEQQVQDYWLQNHSFEVTEDPTREKFSLPLRPPPHGPRAQLHHR